MFLRFSLISLIVNIIYARFSRAEEKFNTERKLAKCGLVIGLSVDIGEYLHATPQGEKGDQLKIVVESYGDITRCKLVLNKALCLPSKCTEDLCSTLAPDENEEIEYVLEEKGGGVWGVGCAVFTKSSPEPLVSPRSGDSEGGRGVRQMKGTWAVQWALGRCV